MPASINKNRRTKNKSKKTTKISKTTSKSISTKKTKKIERNKRYIKKQNIEEKLLIDIAAEKEKSESNGELMVDDEKQEHLKIELYKLSKENQENKLKNKISKSLKNENTQVRKALWSVVEQDDRFSGGFDGNLDGEGTTLGGPTFF
ncbi:Alb1p ASCRUDRAFT_74240 [Ascoidea rubescens DSM 1968]|uniref:Uncharacterized protein n=1 Tax=Ascoidea rubescens DSM 1968 TaxID=1344418 RepID=A0A1D2VMD7_9ASCO|nr:hypothetical protein ASCRUDRAFT_74240 [Ascoidea rubescens DSM 1968]ODV62769.1 hypothetical protein ASCRUDRAFT_74240 [Ascoidea rubescens DSM 1968]